MMNGQKTKGEWRDGKLKESWINSDLYINYYMNEFRL